MSKKMMKCGHAANAYRAHDNAPMCIICLCDQLEEQEMDLKGRTAKCSYCSNTSPSSTDLPFFEHKPERPQDGYYCGCFGWD